MIYRFTYVTCLPKKLLWVTRVIFLGFFAAFLPVPSAFPSSFDTMNSLEDHFQAAQDQMDLLTHEDKAILRSDSTDTSLKQISFRIREIECQLSDFSAKYGYDFKNFRQKKRQIPHLQEFLKEAFLNPKTALSLYRERESLKKLSSEFKELFPGRDLVESDQRIERNLARELKSIKQDLKKLQKKTRVNQKLIQILKLLKDGKSLDFLVRNPYCLNDSYLDRVKDLFFDSKKNSILMIAAMSPFLTQGKLVSFRKLNDSVFLAKDFKDQTAFDHALFQRNLPLLQWILIEEKKRGQSNPALSAQFLKHIQEAWWGAYDSRDSELTNWLSTRYSNFEMNSLVPVETASSLLLDHVAAETDLLSAKEKSHLFAYLFQIFKSLPTQTKKSWLEFLKEDSLESWVASQVANQSTGIDWEAVQILPKESRLEILRQIQKKTETDPLRETPSLWFLAARSPVVDLEEIKFLGFQDLGKKNSHGELALDHALKFKQNQLLRVFLHKNRFSKMVGEEDLKATLEKVAKYSGERHQIEMLRDISSLLPSNPSRSGSEKKLRGDVFRSFFQGHSLGEYEKLEFQTRFPSVRWESDFDRKLEFTLELERIFPLEMKEFRKERGYERLSFFESYLSRYVDFLKSKKNQPLLSVNFLPLFLSSETNKVKILRALSQFEQGTFRCDGEVKFHLKQVHLGRLCRSWFHLPRKLLEFRQKKDDE